MALMQSWFQPIQNRMDSGGTLAHSWWDPVQQRSDQSFLQQGMQRIRAAQGAPYGSLAQQWDPSNYGSQFSQWAPTVAANDPAAAAGAFSGMNRRPSSMSYYM